jgi:hypothetical protein
MIPGVGDQRLFAEMLCRLTLRSPIIAPVTAKESCSRRRRDTFGLLDPLRNGSYNTTDP